MQLQWNSQSCTYLHSEGCRIHSQEQAQEVRLPDGMPDVGRILCAWGQPVLRSKEWRGDSISLTGGVSAWILYLPEEESEPRSIEVWLPFQSKWDRPEGNREGVIQVSCVLRDVDARMLSARKMMVRTNVSLQGQIFQTSQLEIFTPEEESQGVQLLKKTYPLCLRKEAGEKPFLLQEEIPVTGETPKTILGCDAQCILTEQNAVGNKAVFRGNCQLHLVYLGQDEKIHSQYTSVPFSQFTELDGEYGKEAGVQTIMAFSSLEPEIMEGHVHLKCGLVAQYVICDCQLVQIAEDAYSLQQQVHPELQSLQMQTVLDEVRPMTQWEGQAQLSATAYCDMSFFADHPTKYREGEQVILELLGCFQVLYYDAYGNLCAEKISSNSRMVLHAGEGAQPEVLCATPQIPETDGTGQQTHLSCPCQWDVVTMAEQSFPMICSLQLGEKRELDSERPALILRRAGEDTLWSLAKRYGSTVDAICHANHLEMEPEAEHMLLIPIL